MVDHIVDTSAPRSLVEIRSGVGRRRRWSEEEKGRIVAESYAPDAVVSEVARRHEISPQYLFAWRKAARDGRLTLPADDQADPASRDRRGRGNRRGNAENYVKTSLARRARVSSFAPCRTGQRP
jgi:transposase-like protein